MPPTMAQQHRSAVHRTPPAPANGLACCTAPTGHPLTLKQRFLPSRKNAGCPRAQAARPAAQRPHTQPDMTPHRVGQRETPTHSLLQNCPGDRVTLPMFGGSRQTQHLRFLTRSVHMNLLDHRQATTTMEESVEMPLNLGQPLLPPAYPHPAAYKFCRYVSLASLSASGSRSPSST